MPTQSFPVEALSVDGVPRPPKSPYRTSIFRELDDVPRVWGRESISGYNSKRTLTPGSDVEKEYSIDGSAGSHGRSEVVGIGRHPIPTGSGYEMPEHYGGKEIQDGDSFAIPLAGNNNTWVPPSEEPKRICGLGQRTLWMLLAIICFLVIIGGVAAGVVVAKFKSSSASRHTSSTISIGIPVTFAPSTQTTWRTSTMTLANGSVILTTEIITAIQTITPKPSSISQAFLSTSTIIVSADSSSTIIPSPIPGSISPTSPSATLNTSSDQVLRSTVSGTLSTITPSPTLSAAPQWSSPQILES